MTAREMIFRGLAVIDALCAVALAAVVIVAGPGTADPGVSVPVLFRVIWLGGAFVALLLGARCGWLPAVRSGGLAGKVAAVLAIPAAAFLLTIYGLGLGAH